MGMPDFKIQDSNGRTVYRDDDGGLENAYLFIWRDLLLSAVVHSPNNSLAKKLVADIESLGLSNKMLERLEDEIMRELQLPVIAL